MPRPQPREWVEVTVKQAETLWSKIERRGPDECWEWTAGVDGNGYGCIGVNGIIIGAHRLAFMLYHNRPINGILRHTCDNVKCCNAASHLIEGTDADNAADMASRGRSVKDRPGFHGGNAKLTVEIVEEMRRLRRDGKTLSVIGKKFGVSISAVGKACLGKHVWRHISSEPPLPKATGEEMTRAARAAQAAARADQSRLV